MSNAYQTSDGYAPPPNQSAYPQLGNNNNQGYNGGQGYPQIGGGDPQYQTYNPSDKILDVESGERFDYAGSKCHDKGFIVLFVLHLAAVVLCAVLYGKKAIDSWQPSVEPSDPTISLKSVLLALAAAGVAGLAFGAIWLYVMKRCTATIIKISLVLNVIVFAGAAGFALVRGAVGVAVLFAVLALFQCLYFYCVRHRIPFTKAIMTASVSSVQTNPGSINVVYLMALLNVIWVMFWGFTTAAITNHFQVSNGEKEITATHGLAWFFLLISFYWTGQVLKNVGHVTVSGSVASWWLVPTQPAPTCGAFKRAMTTSFGSICFGSLLVAVLSAMRAVVRQAKDQARRRGSGGAACALCCLECILRSLERLIRYFNMYAYTHVAIYGKDFISAAKDTWAMFSNRGFEVLINDDLTGMVLSMGCFLGALFSALVGGAVVLFSQSSTDTTTWGAVAGVSFLIGFLLTALIMSVVQSAVATTYVVWAEMPNEIAQTRPQHYQQLVEASRILHPDRNF